MFYCFSASGINKEQIFFSFVKLKTEVATLIDASIKVAVRDEKQAYLL